MSKIFLIITAILCAPLTLVAEQLADGPTLLQIEKSHEQRLLKLRCNNYATEEMARKLLLTFIQSRAAVPFLDWSIEINFYGKDGSFPPPKSVSFIRLEKENIAYGMVRLHGGVAIKRRENIGAAMKKAEKEHPIAIKE